MLNVGQNLLCHFSKLETIGKVQISLYLIMEVGYEDKKKSQYSMGFCGRTGLVELVFCDNSFLPFLIYLFLFIDKILS
jgi:hypothetical protein